MWWIIGIVGIVAILAAIFFISNSQLKAWEAGIQEEGKLVLCWIVQASDSLYESSNAPGYAEARIVFSTKSAPDLNKKLKDAARRLKKGEIVDEDIDVERVETFYDKYKNLKWLNPPLLLPKWLIGEEIKAYTAVAQVYWKRLPKKRLKLPYIYCWVLLGEKGGVVMSEYPEEDDEDED